MEKEQIIQAIQELIDTSKLKGYVTIKEIKRYVDENADEFDEIITELEKANVDVVSEEDLVTYKVPSLSLEDEDELEPEEDENFVLDLDFAKDIEEELLHDKSFESQASIKVDDPVRMYLKEIGRVELLDPDHELELAQHIYYAALAKEQYEQMQEEDDSELTQTYKKEVEELL